MSPSTMFLSCQDNFLFSGLNQYTGTPLECGSWAPQSTTVLYAVKTDLLHCTKQRNKCLAQGHNAVSTMSLEPVNLSTSCLTLYH